MTGSRKIMLFLAVAIVALGAGGWYALQWAGRGDDSIRVSGNIEAVEVAISFKIPGRVEKRYVDEGEPVYEGKPVAQLETADLQADAGPGPRPVASGRSRAGRVAGRFSARRKGRLDGC